jgi:hypothetical protein
MTKDVEHILTLPFQNMGGLEDRERFFGAAPAGV